MQHRIFTTSFSSVYPHYVAKAERKGQKRSDVDLVIRWLTGYSQDELEKTISDEVTFKQFFDNAPAFNPNATLITGLICGIRVEQVDDPLMQKIRYMDKLVDEVGRGKKMTSILRS